MNVGRVDVVICTKDPDHIRPDLMAQLNSALWVNSIIVETSKPLARARVAGNNKCTTRWRVTVDDDVTLPDNWFEKVSSRIEPGVVAVSSPDIHVDKDYLAYQRLADKLKRLEDRDTPFIDNLLYLGSVFDGYDPPSCFYCEDEFFYRHVKTKGRWVHTEPIGVIHYYKEKDSLYSGAAQRLYKFEPAHAMLRRLVVRFGLAVFTSFYTRSAKTIYRYWRLNVRLMAGWLMGDSLREKAGTAVLEGKVSE